jgi:lipid-A-disaccharide synthase
MAAAGVELAVDMTQHSVLGLSDVIKNMGRFRALMRQLTALAVERQPHAIICVDYSGFNGRFAGRVAEYVRERRGSFNNWHPKIVQFVSPQVWASRERRAYTMSRNFDLLLSIFPFEKSWYAERVPDFPVEFVGHPMLDRYGQVPLRTPAADSPLVVLLPGSRASELERHVPVMVASLEKIRAAVPGVRTRMVLPDQALMEQATEMRLPADLEVRAGNLGESLLEATVALSKTGTVSMECAYFGVPAVTLYKTSWFNYEIAKRLVKVKSLTMANLLAGEPVFPEFLQHDATPDHLAGAVVELLRDGPRREKVRARLKEIVASLGGPGASRRAAAAIVKLVS